jgi:hypothetical protein
MTTLIREQTSIPAVGDIWADDGALGKGFVHAPRLSRVATIDTFGESVHYKWDGEETYAVALIYGRGERAYGTLSGPRAFDGRYINNRVADRLAGRVFNGVDDLADALKDLGFDAVVQTHSGGSYTRIR